MPTPLVKTPSITQPVVTNYIRTYLKLHDMVETQAHATALN